MSRLKAMLRKKAKLVAEKDKQIMSLKESATKLEA